MTQTFSRAVFSAAFASAAFVALSFHAAPAHADAAMAKAKNCTACHAVDKKLIGPSFKDIAAKYKDDGGAVAVLVGKVQGGGSGVWGQIPMPANPQVNGDEAKALVEWILTQ